MYQEVLKIKVYKLREDQDDFKLADKTYIGCIYVMWKECVNTEKDGESKLIQYKEEFRDPDGECNVDFTGMLNGELKWIKFGH
jgi:hypothetical protein